MVYVKTQLRKAGWLLSILLCVTIISSVNAVVIVKSSF